MFNLEQEIQNYCQTVHENGLDQEERIDELKDHLYCEIERLVKSEGLTEQQAFYKTIEFVGNADDLKNEYSKNDTVYAILIDIAKGRILKPMNPKKAAVLQIVVALIFAGMILVADYCADHSQYAEYSVSIRNWLLIAYLFPMMYLSTLERKCGWCGFATIKRKVSNLFHRG